MTITQETYSLKNYIQVNFLCNSMFSWSQNIIFAHLMTDMIAWVMINEFDL